MANRQQKGISALENKSKLDKIRDFMAEVAQKQLRASEAKQEAMQAIQPTAAQTAYIGSIFAPGAGTIDAAGNFPAFPSSDVALQDAFSGEPMPSMAENIQSGGIDRYLMAPLQGLGVVGDAAYGIPVAGPAVAGLLKTPAALATIAGGIAKASKAKGITALDDTKKMLKADVDEFAKDEFGFVSPTLEALIQKAPANLKGKQITEWLNANASKGVKPKEMEFLGFDDYIAANPDANVREVVAGVSPSKVRVTKQVTDQSNQAPLLEFDTQVSMSDPLDGSSPWDVTAADIIDDPEPYEPFVIEAYNKLNPANMVDNLEDAQDGISKGLANAGDVAEMAAEAQYLENPYVMIQPQTQIGPGNYDNMPAFAHGNDDVGYQIFVNGQRVTDTDNIAYSQTEAQIQLRNSMQEELGTDPFRVEGEDYDTFFDGEGGSTKYKQYVDESLPGGENYREVVFRWDNAPVAHNATDHFDDDQAIAHALIRDRKLEDGSNSLHIDELQSDVHTAGSKYGYKESEQIARMSKELVDEAPAILAEYDDFVSRLKNNILNGYNDNQIVVGNSNKNELLERLQVARDHYTKDPTQRYGIYMLHEAKNTISNAAGMQLDGIDKLGPGLVSFDRNTSALLKKADSIQNAPPNYPYKDDWYKMGIQQLLVDAVDEGKDAISISGSLPMKQRYSDKYASFYETLYDQKIPSAMKKIANKYGGKFEKGSLDLADTFGERGVIEGIPSYETEEIANATANIIRITPEMKAKILEEGFSAFAKGGAVTSGIEALPMQPVYPKEYRGIGSIPTGQ